MSRRVVLLGSGEMATACALSFLSSGSARPLMAARDAEYLHDLRVGSRTFRPFDRRHPVPSGLSVAPLASEWGPFDAAVLCVPSAALSDAALLSPAQRQRDAPLFLFTRGLTPDGRTPLDCLRPASARHGPCRDRCEERGGGVVVASGPLFAREWAASRGSNSGVAMTLAMDTPNTPSRNGDDSARGEAWRALAAAMWPQESITWYTAPHAAEVLSLVNASALLCAFGAGMVSSAFPASVSAAMSYLQHALHATERLVNGVLGRVEGTPLPAGAVSTLAMACTNHASREFVFGRRLNFYFKQKDALRAVFPGATHESLNETVEGLHTLLTRTGMASPFYEVLMDSFLTVLRASVAGRGLVRIGEYNYRELNPEESPLLQHTMSVDEAMLSGDEERFEEAKRNLEKAFSGAPNPLEGATANAPEG